MTELNNYRLEIDEIDQQLTRLIEQRFDIAKKVVDYKIKHDLPVLDSSREEIVIKKNQERLINTEYQVEIAEFYQNLMSISRSIQSKILDEK